MNALAGISAPEVSLHLGMCHMPPGKVSLGRSPEEKSARHGLSFPQAAHQLLEKWGVRSLPFSGLPGQAWVPLRTLPYA